MFNIRFTQTSIDHALQIMERLAQLPCAKPFLLPVDPVRDGVPNYYHIITQPIDISLINEKLLLIKYNFVHEWIRDMFQIRDNAKTFNGANSFIYLLSRRLIEHFEKELKEFYIYNSRLWTKRYQEISKKLQEQMKQVPSILSNQGQGSTRSDQLISQNISSLILNDSQTRKPIPIQNSTNYFNPKPLNSSTINPRFESNNELPSNDHFNNPQPIFVQQKPEEPQPNPPIINENTDHKEPANNFNNDLELHDNEVSHFKEDAHPTSAFHPIPQSNTSIFSFGQSSSSRTGSIFGDIDPLSLPPTLPKGDSSSTTFSKNDTLKMNSSSTESFSAKPQLNFPQNSIFKFPNSTSITPQMPPPPQHPIFPQPQFQQQQQQHINGNYRPNFYGIASSLIADPSTISPPEIGPIVNSKPNFKSESDSTIPYVPEPAIPTSLSATSTMNNTDMNPIFSHSIRFINSTKSDDKISEQKKLLILQGSPFVNSFSDMLTINRILSMKEPNLSTTNNEIDLALLSPSTIDEVLRVIGQKMKFYNRPVHTNLDS